MTGIRGAINIRYFIVFPSKRRTLPNSFARQVIIPATPIEYIKTVLRTRLIIRSMRSVSLLAADSEISGTRSPANDDDIADGNKTSGKIMLCNVPYAARDISLSEPLFSNPQGIRRCSTVTSAERT